MTTGWQCPVCGCGVAPTVERCFHNGTPFGAKFEIVESALSPTDAASDDGWIEWKGGSGRPYGVRVRVRCRSGYEFEGDADKCVWMHERASADIVAYKVLP